MILQIMIKRDNGGADTDLGVFRMYVDVRSQCMLEQLDFEDLEPRGQDGMPLPEFEAKQVIQHFREAGIAIPQVARTNVGTACQLIDSFEPLEHQDEDEDGFKPKHKKGADIDMLKAIVKGALMGAAEYPDKIYVELILTG